ncbi:MAG: FMN-binding protein [Bacteroidota bacterium]|nr:FMN-binding protein [Bacteroidota bacterium]
MLAFVLLCGMTASWAQGTKKAPPVFHAVSNKQLVQSVFPEASKVEKINSYWFRVEDNQNKTLGFALSSADYCKDVKGYNNVTPVMIITDKGFVIKKVALESNYETLNFVRMLEKNGFFNSWVGKTVSKAKSAEIDGSTGATYTANAVRKNVDFLLTNGAKKMPKK